MACILLWSSKDSGVDLSICLTNALSLSRTSHRNPGVAGSTGVQVRLLQCLSGQVCLSGAAFYNDVDDLAVEVDPITNGLQVSLNGVPQAANIGQVSSSSFTFQYLSAFSIQVSQPS